MVLSSRHNSRSKDYSDSNSRSKNQGTGWGYPDSNKENPMYQNHLTSSDKKLRSSSSCYRNGYEYDELNTHKSRPDKYHGRDHTEASSVKDKPSYFQAPFGRDLTGGHS